MPPPLAAVVFGVGVLALFLFDREKATPGSKALWIPIVWLFFCSTRSLSQWFGIGGMGPSLNEVSAYAAGSPADRILFIILEVIALIVVIKRRRKVLPILRSNWVIGLYFLYAALSMTWSDYPFVTFKHWIKGIGDLLMVLIVFTEPD